MNLGTALVAVRADIKDLRRDLDAAKQQTSKATSAMQRNATSVEAAFRKMWFAIGGAGLAVMTVRTFGQAIKAASDLQEVTNKFNVVFKGQQTIAEGWTKTLVNAYSMSTREAKQYLSSVQDLLVPMGMAAKEAGKLSFEIVKLSADLGSFNNLPTAQVMLDIQSALVGNFETMKKYGVVLNAANVKQEALNMGLVTNIKELNAAEKAQAAYSLIVKGSQAAIGDNARSVGSYAKTLKDATAAWEDFMAELGKTVLPAATIVLQWVTDWLKDFLYVLEELKKIRRELQGLPAEPYRQMIRAPIPGAGPGAPTPPTPTPSETAEKIDERIKTTNQLYQNQIEWANLARDAEGALQDVQFNDYKAKTLEQLEMEDEIREERLATWAEFWNDYASLHTEAMQSWMNVAMMAMQIFAAKSEKWQLAMIAVETGINVARALIFGHAAAVKALAEVPYPANLGVYAQMMALTYSNVAAIIAAGAVKAYGATQGGGAGVGGGVGGGGTQTGFPGPPGTIGQPEDRGQIIHIHFDGGVITDDDFLEDLAEKISELVEGSEVRLISSGVRES